MNKLENDIMNVSLNSQNDLLLLKFVKKLEKIKEASELISLKVKFILDYFEIRNHVTERKLINSVKAVYLTIENKIISVTESINKLCSDTEKRKSKI